MTVSTARPSLDVLGPIALHAHGIAPDPGHSARLIELAAYLAIHQVPALSPGRLTAAAVDEAIWPDRSRENNGATRASAVSRLRRWLGADADAAGLPWLEVATLRLRIDTDLARFYGLTGYQTTHSRPSVAPQSLEGVEVAGLVQALALVRSRPLYGVPRGRYAWADRMRIEIELDTATVAAHVADHATNRIDRLRAAAIAHEMMPAA